MKRNQRTNKFLIEPGVQGRFNSTARAKLNSRKLRAAIKNIDCIHGGDLDISNLYIPILAALEFVTAPHNRWLGVRSPAVQETSAENSNLDQQLQKFIRGCKSSSEIVRKFGGQSKSSVNVVWKFSLPSKSSVNVV